MSHKLNSIRSKRSQILQSNQLYQSDRKDHSLQSNQLYQNDRKDHKSQAISLQIIQSNQLYKHTEASASKTPSNGYHGHDHTATKATTLRQLLYSFYTTFKAEGVCKPEGTNHYRTWRYAVLYKLRSLHTLIHTLLPSH